MVKDNRHLGRFYLNGLPPGRAGDVKVKISLKIDSNKLVQSHVLVNLVIRLPIMSRLKMVLLTKIKV